MEVQLEVGLAADVAHVELHLVREIEAALGLDDVREHRQDVAVLLVELELDLGLVPLEIFGTHGPPFPSPAREVRRSVALP